MMAPDWSKMTRDEIEGHAVALWNAANAVIFHFEINTPDFCDSDRVILSDLNEALK